MNLSKNEHIELTLSLSRIEDCILEGIPDTSGYKKAALREVRKVQKVLKSVERLENYDPSRTSID